ncbi:hypothetical protein [Undibacterium amnicola]|uniref:hypothetical protein n=1 Tax=Undibacterium amnicola TaxID=1834038 RepID=UPI001FEA6740|nr:hypothetical protein [Undibacterium amnicola]
MDELFKHAEHTVVVHYSCENFYDRGENPRSPRTTYIAVRNLDSGQTKSFSIHLIAEQRGLLDSIEQHYDDLEREMLLTFFDAVKERQHCLWMHWNMRDANYGFEALENRLKALGSVPNTSVPESKRYDLSRILIGIYGVKYTRHPRIESLMGQNHISARDFLIGQQEADAFEQKQFVRLHQSTLRKVDVLANFAGRAYAGDLITSSGWRELHGRPILAFFELFREHWLVKILGGGIVLVGLAYKAWHWFH